MEDWLGTEEVRGISNREVGRRAEEEMDERIPDAEGLSGIAEEDEVGEEAGVSSKEESDEVNEGDCDGGGV